MQIYECSIRKFRSCMRSELQRVVIASNLAVNFQINCSTIFNHPSRSSTLSGKEQQLCRCVYFCTCKYLLLSCRISINIFIYLGVDISTHLAINLSIYQSIYLSIYLSIYQSIYLSIHPSINLSIYHHL